MADGSINLGAGFTVRQSASVDFKTGFFVLPYRTPYRIKQKNLYDPDSGAFIGIDREWGAVLCIDPNGIRPTGPKGPIFILLDTVDIRPSITSSNGVMVASIDDGESPRMGTTRNFKKSLFATELFIRDNDEFWIGVQQGPAVMNNWQGLNQTWSPVSGGREWLMGGYISKRYWKEDVDGRCTAYIEGKCYMDVWRDQPFGTPTQQRNYEVDTDFATVAVDVLTDVNNLQLIEHQYSASTSYWPGVGPVPALTDISINKEYKNDMAFSVMRKHCEDNGWEWKIVVDPTGVTPAARRAVMLYERSNMAPLAPQYRIEYTRNIRENTKIMKGDTSELVTNVIITDGEVSMIPPDRMMWAHSGLWPDKANANREYTYGSVPPPPNAKTQRYTDSSLVIDDEAYPAINFQKDSVPTFDVFLSFYTDETGEPMTALMDIDLRKWRRLRFKFKHGTRDTGVNVYRVRLHTLGSGGYDRFNRQAYFTFGIGTQEKEGVSEDDLISDDTSTEIDLLLPEVNADGKTFGNMHGWELVYETDPPNRTLDPTSVDFISFWIQCAEPLPGQDWGGLPGSLAGKKFVERFEIIKDVQAGDMYCYIADPDALAGLQHVAITLSSGEKPFYNPEPYYVIQGRPPGGGGYNVEPIEIDAIKGDYYPQSRSTPGGGTFQCNVRFSRPLIHSYGASSTHFYCLGGWSISISQLRFERNVRLEDCCTSDNPQLRNPRRFKLVTAKEIEYLNEATDLAVGVLSDLCRAQQYITTNLDGDPRTKIGMRMVPYLDPGRDIVFHGSLYMFVDNIAYIVNVSDLQMNLTLGTSGSRAMPLNESSITDQQERKIEGLNQGKTPLTWGIR